MAVSSKELIIECVALSCESGVVSLIHSGRSWMSQGASVLNLLTMRVCQVWMSRMSSGAYLDTDTNSGCY